MATNSKLCSFCGMEFPNHHVLIRHEQGCRYLNDSNDHLFNIESRTSIPPKKRRLSSPTALSPPSFVPNVFDDTTFMLIAECVCSFCGELFTTSQLRTEHETMHKRDTCAKCGQVFPNILDKNLHETSCSLELLCSSCGGYFRTAALFDAHARNCQNVDMYDEQNNIINPNREPHVRQLLAPPPNEEQILPYEAAFQDRIASYFIQSDFALDLPMFLHSIKPKIVRLLNNVLDIHGPIKFTLFVDCILANVVGDQIEGNLKTKFDILLQNESLHSRLEVMFTKLNTELCQLEAKGSGWKLDTILGVRLKICKYSPLRGGANIKIPSVITNRKACVNVPGDDDRCFKYAILAKFLTRRPDRLSSYYDVNHHYNFSGINSWPASLRDVKDFEKRNNISICIFTLNKKNIVTPLKSVHHQKEDHRDLLLLESDEKRHYVWIKDFNKLVASQISRHEHRVNVCKRCLWFKQSDPLSGDVKTHESQCNTNAPVAVQMPKKDDNLIKFKEVHKVLKVPYVIYADFESLLKEINSCSPDPQTSYLEHYNKHVPISACAKLIIDPKYEAISQHFQDKLLFEYRGVDVVDKLLQYLESVAKEVVEMNKRNLPMKELTDQEQYGFETATKCYLCDRDFSQQDSKVRDHCHILGNFRGAAHQSCNLNFKKPNFLPVFFHNLSAYDAQFLIPKMNFTEQRVDVLAQNKEKYISFSKYVNPHFSIRFLDSYRFLSSSLDSLARNLTEFNTLSEYFPDPDQLALAKQKGVYPYEYMNSMERFQETQLPPKDAFYSKLRHEGISDEEYERAQKVWETFKCANLGQYHDLYNKIDTLLLTDIFETFRSTTLNSHKLDPAQFYTTPQMSWAAMLRHTKAEIELLTDYNMLLMFEAGIRGGLCQVSKRYAEANNPLIAGYNPQKPTSYISYQDCNALYATVMTKPLPIGNFEWVNPKDVPSLDQMKEDDEYGYILDVDIASYPDELHDNHNDLPFFPERLKSLNNKLCAHLGSRKSYVAHYVTLKQAKKFGVITARNPIKINRAIRFKQVDFLRSYIELNNNLRKVATTDFEKDLFKLYNNAIYGKTCEQIRNRIDVRLVTKWKQAEKMMAKSNFKDADILNENLVAIEMGKTSICFDKPIFIGQAVLDLSKAVMYEYMYGVMKPMYPGDKMNLLYMDTDSFIMEIMTDNFYKDMEGNMVKNHLDTSNYPRTHPLYSDLNKKALGKFKDEVAGKPIKRFVGLRPKMYALEIHTDNERENDKFKKVKGIQRAVVLKKIQFQDYVNCMNLQRNDDGQLQIRRDICTSIRSKKHQLFSISLNKVSLSPFDDKRHIMGDNIHTLAINHKFLRNEDGEIPNDGGDSDDEMSF